MKTSVGARFKTRRELIGITQAALSESAGVSRFSVQALEKDEGSNLVTVLAVASVLEMDLGELNNEPPACARCLAIAEIVRGVKL